MGTIAEYGLPPRVIGRRIKQPKDVDHITRKGEVIKVTARQKAAYEAAKGRRPPPLDSTPAGAHWQAVMSNARAEQDAYKINQLGYIKYVNKNGKVAWSKPKYGRGPKAMTTAQAFRAASGTALPFE